MKLFTLEVPLERVHPNFRRTLGDDSRGVRDVLASWAAGFVDRDRKFIKEFQTTYNSGFWELYLFAVLKHHGIAVDFSFNAPDFICPSVNLLVEAVTANHAFDDTPEWEKTVGGITGANLENQYRQSIIRLGNALSSKLVKLDRQYSRLAHFRDNSFVIAVSNYATQDFYMLGDVAMQRLLYDVRDEGAIEKQNGSKLKLGMFRDASHASLSAVLFSSTATFGKARALGDDKGTFLFQAVRITDSNELINLVEGKEEYVETLCDGLRLFLNPWAKYPLDPGLFWDDGVKCYDPDRFGGMQISANQRGHLCARHVVRISTKR